MHKEIGTTPIIIYCINYRYNNRFEIGLTSQELVATQHTTFEHIKCIESLIYKKYWQKNIKFWNSKVLKILLKNNKISPYILLKLKS